MLIKRSLQNQILNDIKSNQRGIVIYGARQVGKTTLANQLLADLKLKTLYLNGDQLGDWLGLLESRELSKYKLLLSGYEAVFVDEAQRIRDIGISLKIILDNFPNLVVIVTGSSSLDLASKISEPLTGRVYTYMLFPLAYTELEKTFTPYELRSSIEERLIFGSYPKITQLEGMEEKTNYLTNLTGAYLYKDLIEFGDIKNSSKIGDLLKLLAFQIGSQVSFSELAKKLEISRNTVERYIDLLEQSFIIYRLRGYNKNLRKEVIKMPKIYFYDLGVRNTIMGNLHLLKSRDDSGKLWENFLINERIKKIKYLNKIASFYFWRLSSGAELDLIEDINGDLMSYEFKFNNKVAKAPQSWVLAYPKASFKSINKDNFYDFIL